LGVGNIQRLLTALFKGKGNAGDCSVSPKEGERSLPMSRIRRQTFVASIMMAALALVAAGCFTVGRQFPIEAVSQIRIGQTTQEEVRRLFGAPWRMGIEDEMKTWTYGHYRYALFGSTKASDLVVRFDRNGVVISYSFNATTPKEE